MNVNHKLNSKTTHIAFHVMGNHLNPYHLFVSEAKLSTSYIPHPTKHPPWKKSANDFSLGFGNLVVSGKMFPQLFQKTFQKKNMFPISIHLFVTWSTVKKWRFLQIPFLDQQQLRHVTAPIGTSKAMASAPGEAKSGSAPAEGFPSQGGNLRISRGPAVQFFHGFWGVLGWFFWEKMIKIWKQMVRSRKKKS